MTKCPACGHEFHQPRRPRPKWVAEVVCSCGAKWLGKYAVENRVIEDHRARGHQVKVIVEAHLEPAV